MKKLILQIGVSLLFIGLLFYLMRDDFPEILHTLKNVNRPLVALAFLVCLSTVLIMAKRLQLIFAAEDVPVKIADTSNLTFVGFFFNNFLPTPAGGGIATGVGPARIT